MLAIMEGCRTGKDVILWLGQMGSPDQPPAGVYPRF